MLPKLALYQIELHLDMKFSEFPKVVKTVVKGYQPQFWRTFWWNKQGVLRRNGGVCNISERRTGLVFQVPNQAPYQLGHTRI